MATRRLELVFTGDTRGLERAFGRAGAASHKMGGGFASAAKGAAKLAAIGTAGLGVAFVAGLGKAASAASDLNESLNKSAATFERSSGAVERWANTATTSLGMTKAAALDGAASIGAMLKPMGVAPNQAAKMSMRMTQLAADMASFNNQDPTEMLDRIRAGLSGESEPLKQFGAVLSETRVKQEAYRTGLAQTGAELTEQQKIQARYSLLLRDTRDQQGDFAKTSDGMANATRIAKAELNQLAAEAGGVLMPTVAKALSTFNGWVASFRENWPQIRPIVVGVMTAVQGALQSVVGWVRQNWPTIKAVTVATFEGARAAVEVAIEWIQANVVPTIRAVVAGARAFWREFGGTITAVFRDVVVVVRSALNVVRGVVETVLAVIRGDWGAAWNGIKTVLSNVWTGIVAVIRGAGRIVLRVMGEVASAALAAFLAPFKRIGGLLRSAFVNGVRGVGDLATFMLNRGREWGGKMVDGIVAAIRSVGGRIKDAILAAIPDSIDIGPVSIPLGGASGGFIPGRYRGVDDRVMRVASGEAILTPKQQAMIPGGRGTLAAIFAATGGRIGGRSFAQGGVAGDSFSGLGSVAGNVQSFYRQLVGAVPGAQYVMSGYRAGSTIQGSGRRSLHADGMAVDIGSRTAKNAGSPSVVAPDLDAIAVLARRALGHSPVVAGTTSNSRGEVLWRTLQGGNHYDHVHVGLKSGATPTVPGVDLSSLGVSVGFGGGSSGSGPQLTPFEAVKRAIQGAGVGSKRAGAIAGRVMTATGAATTGVSDRLSGGSLTSAEQRSVSSAGRSARGAARGLGKSPEDVAKAGEKAERDATARFYKLHIRQIDTERRKLRKAKAKILADLKALPGKKNAANRKAAAKQLNRARATIDAELRELAELRAEANEQLAQLNEATIEDQHAENYGEGPGEPPTELDYLDAAIAQAGLTETTDDDLAAARAMEDYRRREYAAAVASGDPRRISDAATALLGAQQNREQIEATRANTDALNSNTEAMRSLGGSVSFGYRGQDYVLRSLAPPSSDRLDASLLGV